MEVVGAILVLTISLTCLEETASASELNFSKFHLPPCCYIPPQAEFTGYAPSYSSKLTNNVKRDINYRNSISENETSPFVSVPKYYRLLIPDQIHKFNRRKKSVNQFNSSYRQEQKYSQNKFPQSGKKLRELDRDSGSPQDNSTIQNSKQPSKRESLGTLISPSKYLNVNKIKISNLKQDLDIEGTGSSGTEQRNYLKDSPYWIRHLKRALFQSINSRKTTPRNSKSFPISKSRKFKKPFGKSWKLINQAGIEFIDSMSKASNLKNSIILPKGEGPIISGVLINSDKEGYHIRASSELYQPNTLQKRQCTCNLLNPGEILMAYWSLSRIFDETGKPALQYLIYPLPYSVPTPPEPIPFSSSVFEPSPVDPLSGLYQHINKIENSSPKLTLQDHEKITNSIGSRPPHFNRHSKLLANDQFHRPLPHLKATLPFIVKRPNGQHPLGSIEKVPPPRISETPIYIPHQYQNPALLRHYQEALQRLLLTTGIPPYGQGSVPGHSRIPLNFKAATNNAIVPVPIGSLQPPGPPVQLTAPLQTGPLQGAGESEHHHPQPIFPAVQGEGEPNVDLSLTPIPPEPVGIVPNFPNSIQDIISPDSGISDPKLTGPISGGTLPSPGPSPEPIAMVASPLPTLPPRPPTLLPVVYHHHPGYINPAMISYLLHTRGLPQNEISMDQISNNMIDNKDHEKQRVPSRNETSKEHGYVEGQNNTNTYLLSNLMDNEKRYYPIRDPPMKFIKHVPLGQGNDYFRMQRLVKNAENTGGYVLDF